MVCMENRIYRVFIVFLLAPIIAPMLYVGGMLYPYVTPKTLLLRGLAVILAALFTYLVIAGRAFFWQRLKYFQTWIPGILLFVAYATSLLGIDFYHSFWSTFDRGDGLLTLTACVTFFYLVVLSADGSFLSKLYKGVAWVGSAAALYGIVQWVQTTSGVDMPLIAEQSGRIGGTFGNAAFLASYLGMVFFATLAAAPLYKKPWNYMLYGGAVLQVLAIVLTATRGTLLALALVGLAALVYAAWKARGTYRTYARGGLVALMVAAGLFFAFRAQLAHSPLEPIRRVASISLNDPTVSSRLFVWREMLAQSMERPLLGVGAEHIDVLFNKVYDPGAIAEQWFDRSHNAFLDYIVQFGIVGLLLYVALIVGAGLEGWRLFRKEKQPAFLLLVAVYAIQNFFVFDTAITLWLLLVLYAAAIAKNNASVATAACAFPAKNMVAAGVGALLLVPLVWVVVQPLRANMYLAEGYTYHVADVNKAVASMQKGLSLGTYADLEYGYQAYSMYADHQLAALKDTELLAAYTYAHHLLVQNATTYPYDARTVLYLAHVIDAAPAGVVIDNAALTTLLEKVIDLSPNRSQAWYLLSNISIRQANEAKTQKEKMRLYQEAIQTLTTYAEKVPTLDEPRFILASLYFAVGDTKTAAIWADQGLPLYKGSAQVAQRAAGYYIKMEDWPRAAQFLKDVVAAEPADYPVVYDYAKTSFLAGDKAKALEIVAMLRQKAPGLVETDPAFMKALGQ